MTLGTKIAGYRKQLGITQEALANRLEVSNQAVSKWESDQCCPDVMLLPRLADIFGISLDELFGRERKMETAEAVIQDLPWEDDGTLRAVLYIGRRLVKHSPEAKEITFTYDGPALDVDSAFAVSCGDVAGDVDAGGNVTCGAVGGDTNAGGNVECKGDIGGDVDAGGNVACKNVGGDVDAGGDVACGNVDGYVDTGRDVACGNVGGYVDAGRDVNCGNVEGSVDAGGGVTCGDVSGNVDAGSYVECGSVGGDVDAGGKVTIGK